jgi:diguanylate cyclase (GGDEF)-like protein
MCQVAVLFVDLDGFKHINDSLGHLIGDKLLQSIAKRLLECVRTPDTVSRQGGDEFVILLQEVLRPEDTANTTRRVLQTISEAHSIDNHDLYVTASIGVSMYPSDGLNVETLLKNADTAMYQAKEDGRQCCKFFAPAMNVRAVERQSIEEDLRYALKKRNSHCITNRRSISGQGLLRELKHCSAGCTPLEDACLHSSSFE